MNTVAVTTAPTIVVSTVSAVNASHILYYNDEHMYNAAATLQRHTTRFSAKSAMHTLALYQYIPEKTCMAARMRIEAVAVLQQLIIHFGADAAASPLLILAAKSHSYLSNPHGFMLINAL
jgi:hypothetical protein